LRYFTYRKAKFAHKSISFLNKNAFRYIWIEEEIVEKYESKYSKDIGVKKGAFLIAPTLDAPTIRLNTYHQAFEEGKMFLNIF
jgi:hypothetical protein